MNKVIGYGAYTDNCTSVHCILHLKIFITVPRSIAIMPTHKKSYTNAKMNNNYYLPMSTIMRYAETRVLNGANSNFTFIQLACF